MSVIEELATRLRAASDDLPVAQVATALEHLRRASDQLRRVREASTNPMGVPELSAATEHAQMASYALTVAREHLAGYLAGIGLAGAGHTDTSHRPDPGVGIRPEQPPASPAPGRTRGWWHARVDTLVDRHPPDPTTNSSDSLPTCATVGTEAGDGDELLRRVAQRLRDGDHAGLHRELRTAGPEVGLALTSAAAPALRTLAAELLGHPPRSADLRQLRHEVSGELHRVLPGLPETAADTLLRRLCRMPPAAGAHPPHPADPPVAAAVLTGLLLRRLGHRPHTVARESRA